MIRRWARDWISYLLSELQMLNSEWPNSVTNQEMFNSTVGHPVSISKTVREIYRERPPNICEIFIHNKVSDYVNKSSISDKVTI